MIGNKHKILFATLAVSALTFTPAASGAGAEIELVVNGDSYVIGLDGAIEQDLPTDDPNEFTATQCNALRAVFAEIDQAEEAPGGDQASQAASAADAGCTLVDESTESGPPLPSSGTCRDPAALRYCARTNYRDCDLYIEGVFGFVRVCMTRLYPYS